MFPKASFSTAFRVMVLAPELRTHLHGRCQGYLFESNRHTRYAVRTVQTLVRRCAHAAVITRRVHPHLLRDETCYRKPAAFTVAAVVHLAAGCQNMPAGDGDRADQADDAAAAFGFSFYETRGGAVGRSRSRGKTPAGRDELGDGLRRHVSLPELGSWKVGKLKG